MTGQEPGVDWGTNLLKSRLPPGVWPVTPCPSLFLWLEDDDAVCPEDDDEAHGPHLPPSCTHGYAHVDHPMMREAVDRKNVSGNKGARGGGGV